jgi:protein-disulfide isomerase
MIILGLLLPLLAGLPQSQAEQSPQGPAVFQELKKEIEALKEGQADIQKQIQEIKKLAQARPTPRPSAIGKVVSVAAAPFKGDKNARVTILEFSEYQCPFCAVYSTTTMPLIEKEYVKTGKVKYAFRDFPLVRIHPLAFKAAEATHCAADQEKYWEMHNWLFANNTALKPEDLSRHAKSIGLNVPAFDACLASEKHAATIRKDMQDGESVGLTATPFFLIGLTEADGAGLKVATTLSGSQPFEKFKEAIDKLLEQGQPSK